MIDATNLFDSIIPGINVLIIGDVMIDTYMWGNVNRISPEAPVPVVAITKRDSRLGGAANVALNIRSLGARPIICSVIGKDDAAKEFMHLLYAHDMDRRGIISSDDRMTTVKSRVIGNNMHIVRIDEETTRPISSADEDELVARVERIVKTTKIDAIIFQDYDKGVITPKIIDKVTALARHKGIIITVDPKHQHFRYFHHATLFKPNLKELVEGLNLAGEELNEQNMLSMLERASLELHEQQQFETVCVTLSSKGMYVCEFKDGEPLSTVIPAQSRSVSDVSGAGDTVISVATLCLAAGLDTRSALRSANAAGGIVCEQVGVVPIDRDRLRAAMCEMD